MRLRYLLAPRVFVVPSALGCLSANAQDETAGLSGITGVDRSVLPPPAPEFKGKIGKNYKELTPDF
jgi:hypothetical protein